MKIAICDDDKKELLQIYQLVDEFLKCGFANGKIEVHSFESSIELIEQLERDKYFDVFLLDVIMPGINGIELAADIRSKDQVGKIIFLTSSLEFVKVETVLLADKRFMKPHRSYIVNLDYIKNLSKNSFTTTSNHLIPISRNVFKGVNQAYINYSFQEEE